MNLFRFTTTGNHVVSQY